MIARGQNFKQYPLTIAGSSVFGRYPKINVEKTENMFLSDGWLVNYAGYETVIDAAFFSNGIEGRGLHTSTKLGKLIAVVDNGVYLVSIDFDVVNSVATNVVVNRIGTLQTTTGVVYIAENNKPQVLISDGFKLYLYDPTSMTPFSIPTIDFVPGYIDFHDTYFLCAAQIDPPEGNATNVWRLSDSNQGDSWPPDAAHVGFLQTKPDNIQAVVRFPSRGNMVLVMGKTVTEAWFDVGYQLFPYQRNSSMNIDYGCLNPATIAATDEIVCWLGINEKSGPIIVYTTGGMIEKITTDGIDYLFSQLQSPQDSQGFIFRQDGHLIYHINFYTDNLSLFYDFNTKKFFNACDDKYNYFIAGETAFFNNQYYFLTKNNGNMYAFDTAFTTYDGVTIPRVRICNNVRDPSQQYFIANDVGFTIETGETEYLQQPVFADIFIVSEAGDNLITEINNFFIVDEQSETTGYVVTTPRVDFSISTDGGATFGSEWAYYLPPLAHRKNRLMWWQLGIANDFVCQFKFWGIGRFVAYDGIVNVRQ
jgi:hypothetical protein